MVRDLADVNSIGHDLWAKYRKQGYGLTGSFAPSRLIVVRSFRDDCRHYVVDHAEEEQILSLGASCEGGVLSPECVYGMLFLG